MKHTTAPWHRGAIAGWAKEIRIFGSTLFGNIIAWVDYDDVDHEEQAANARLIVKAPDLFALLKEWMEAPMLYHLEDRDRWRENFRARVEAVFAEVEG